uniref:Uncharacterized protein n=1 Tax=Siphoviridae sp. ctwfx1 TaxID=2825732 RepID=A0A8S5UVP5_9CAUD|nr:MAG TPA: hypothetical protein [Siphoviridae sp. ctwfx1]
MRSTTSTTTRRFAPRARRRGPRWRPRARQTRERWPQESEEAMTCRA